MVVNRSGRRDVVRMSDLVTLAVARQRAALSQGELARAAGVTHATVSRVETRRAKPRPSTRRALAQALGLSPAEIAWEGIARGVA